MVKISDEQLEKRLTQIRWPDLSEQYDETQDHPVDDVALLDAWARNDLTEDELHDLNNHLEQCYYCRREVAAMIKSGTLAFDESADVISPARPWFNFRQSRTLIVVAASILLAVVCINRLNFQDKTNLARNDLILKHDALTDYDYDFNGILSGIKGGEIEPNQLEEQRFQDQIAKNFDDMALRFEYGQWLLGEHRLSDAITEFEKIEKIHPNSATVQNALGMAWFMKETGQAKTPTIARGHFLKATQLAPNDRGINLNMAICLTVLGNKTEAEKYFDKAGVER